MIVPEGDGRWAEYAGGYSDMLAQRGGGIAGGRPEGGPGRGERRAVSQAEEAPGNG